MGNMGKIHKNIGGNMGIMGNMGGVGTLDMGKINLLKKTIHRRKNSKEFRKGFWTKNCNKKALKVTKKEDFNVFFTSFSFILILLAIFRKTYFLRFFITSKPQILATN